MCLVPFQGFEPFNFRIEIVSKYSFTCDAALKHIRKQNRYYADLILGGNWHMDQQGNLSREHKDIGRDSHRVFQLVITDEMNTCLFHSDILRLLQGACVDDFVNLSWWKVIISTSYDLSGEMELFITSGRTIAWSRKQTVFT